MVRRDPPAVLVHRADRPKDGKRRTHNMAGKIVIDTERCKGCGLCISVCPNNSIVISKDSNRSGYFPAQAKNIDCTGCAKCAIVCPEGVIEVYLDDAEKIRIVATDGKKSAPHVIEEKA
jgi:2-oxoglutarate ferredoxin oxidoreductase subunit delta